MDRIATAQQHADIATTVVDTLVSCGKLQKAKHGKAYHRCRAILAANPDWTAAQLTTHCLAAYEDRDMRAAQRTVDANIQRCVDKYDTRGAVRRTLIYGGESREVSLAEQYDMDNAPSSFERNM